MSRLKVENGNVKYLYKTFDGTYVEGTYPESAIDTDNLVEDNTVEGYGFTDGKYLFATTTSKPKRSIEDNDDV